MLTDKPPCSTALSLIFNAVTLLWAALYSLVMHTQHLSWKGLRHIWHYSVLCRSCSQQSATESCKTGLHLHIYNRYYIKGFVIYSSKSVNTRGLSSIICQWKTAKHQGSLWPCRLCLRRENTELLRELIP